MPLSKPVNTCNENLLINGDFQVWQRGTSFNTSGAYSSDRWKIAIDYSTGTVSKQTFVVGQTEVTGNPLNFLRAVITSASNINEIGRIEQKIEDVTKLAGQVLTLTFWAKADANKNIAVEFGQNFGSGGSSAIVGLSPQKIAITTNWTKYKVTITLPSVLGKTIGADSYTSLYFWFDAGSSMNSRTNSLESQSGTFDIANIKLEYGSVATSLIPRSYQEEFELCLRYFESVIVYAIGYATASNQQIWAIGKFTKPKRIAGATLTLVNFTDYVNCAVPTTDYKSEYSFRVTGISTASGEVHFTGKITADAEL